MPSHLGFTLTYNNNNGLVPLYPKTPMSQILDEDFGECFGPYQLTLAANKWNSSNQQTVTLAGVKSSDILYCTKVLTGNTTQMQAQDQAYSLLNPYTGIESLNGQVRFTCTSKPTTNFTVQVHWFR